MARGRAKKKPAKQTHLPLEGDLDDVALKEPGIEKKEDQFADPDGIIIS